MGARRAAWSIDGQPAGEGRSLRLPELADGTHEVTVAISDGAGNVAQRSAELEIRPPSQQAAPMPTPTPTAAPVAAPVVVPVAVPRASPLARPRILSARVERRAGGWFLSLRLRDSDRVRLSLVRSPYLSAAALHRRGLRPRCGPPAAHDAEPGAEGRDTQRARGATVRLRLPARFSRALRIRGRYRLRIVALGAQGQRSAATTRRWTVC